MAPGSSCSPRFFLFGLLRLPLQAVLLVAIPASLALTIPQRRRPKA